MAAANTSGKRAVRFFCAFAAGLLAVTALAFGRMATRGEGSGSERAAAGAVPSADRVLERYLEATGGRAAWESVHSRVSKGIVNIPDMQMAGKAELYEKAPDRALVKMVVSGATFLEGFDGTTAWSSDPKDGLQEQTGAQLAETRRESDFRYPLDFRKLYKSLSAVSAAKIGDRSVYVIDVTPPDGGEPDRAYFDAGTDFLIRMVIQHHDNDGSVKPFEEDYGDYRAVDGVKVPFMIHQSGSQIDFTIQLNEVHQNLELDDARFSKPPKGVAQ
ncbi:MAG TPA: hypothetical protein VKS44_08405 [Candidatus Acidoferrales bacterium]|nr:hypothetical protein [Candidatus Acidoferrales bacterium]